MNKDIKFSDIQDDLDKCFIDEEGLRIAQDLDLRIRLNASKEVKRLNPKKNKKITAKISKNTTNEIFWENKNELAIARKEIGFDPIELKIRNCLTCAIRFESEGKHNRVCDDCRKENGF